MIPPVRPGFSSCLNAINTWIEFVIVLYSAFREVFHMGFSAFSLSSKTKSDFIFHDLIVRFVVSLISKVTVLE